MLDSGSVFTQKSICLLALGISLLSACSARPSGGLNQGRVVNYTQCVLPSDQGRGSLEGSWATLPVPIVFDNDFYLTDGGEIVPSLRNAVGTWNTWAVLRGYSGLAITNDGSGAAAGREMPTVTDCAQATYSSQVTDVVGIWKISSSGQHANIRASCAPTTAGAPGRILPTGVQGQTDWITLNGHISGASILLNFEEFNAPGKQRVDVESLLLHELGHVLGLLHSCNGSTTDSVDGTSAPACSSGINNQYLDAVMFPFLEINLIRRKLGQNDYNRINCLY
ncbi:MAG: hypothetical protein ACXWQO_06330 [Bdellovibrionota bacterium]